MIAVTDLHPGDRIMAPTGKYREVQAVNKMLDAVKLDLKVPGSAWGYNILLPCDAKVRLRPGPELREQDEH
jgi:hypothetical protein